MSTLVVIVALALTAYGGTSTTATNSPSSAISIAAASPSPSWSPTMTPIAVPVVKSGKKLPPFTQLAKMFAYDASEPLVLSDEASDYDSTDTVPVRRIVYAGAGREVGALLYVLTVAGPFLAMLFQLGHGPRGAEEAADAGPFEVRVTGYMNAADYSGMIPMR